MDMLFILMIATHLQHHQTEMSLRQTYHGMIQDNSRFILELRHHQILLLQI